MVNPIYLAFMKWYGQYMIFINRLCLWHPINHQAFKDTHIDRFGMYHLHLINTDAKNDLDYLRKKGVNKLVYLDYWFGVIRTIIMICLVIVLFIVMIKNEWYVKGSIMDYVFSNIQIFK